MSEKPEEKSYGSFSEVIKDLRERTESDDPEVAKEAKDVLNTMWKNWAGKAKKDFTKQLDKTFVFR